MNIPKALIISSVLTLIKASDPYCQAPVPQYVVPDPANSQLIQVISVSRHGDRSPLAILPHESSETGLKWECGLPVSSTVGNTPGYKHEYIAPVGLHSSKIWKGNCTDGQLTMRGGVQCHNMGSALRSIYVDKLGLLPTAYDPTQLYVESSEFERTRESMMSMMLGFYPPGTRQGQQINYKLQSGKVSQLFPNDALCPRIVTLWNKNKAQEEWKTRLASLKPILEKLHRIGDTANLPGWSTEKSVGSWHDTLRARACHGLPLPCSSTTGECVTAEEAQKIFDQADYEAKHLYDGEELQKIGIGTFAQRLIDIFNKTTYLLSSGKNLKDNYYKYLHFSAHDSTIMALMAAFKNPIVFPPYASTLIFELWKNPVTNEFMLRMLYNGVPVQLPECSATMCRFEQVHDIVYSRLIIRDLDKECFDS